MSTPDFQFKDPSNQEDFVDKSEEKKSKFGIFSMKSLKSIGRKFSTEEIMDLYD